MKPTLMKYVLVKDIKKHEAEGWRLKSKNIAIRLGDWPTVIMEKEA